MEIPNHKQPLLCFSIVVVLLLLRLISASTPSTPTQPPPSYDLEDYGTFSPPGQAPPPSYNSGDYGGYDDSWDYTPAPPPPPSAPCNPQDRDALLHIRQALNNTAALSSWVPDTDCCGFRWVNVGCDDATGRVIGLYFYGNGWGGHYDIPPILPSAVVNLTSLQNLVFHNNVTGPIPRTLSRLNNLKTVDLSNNRFTGPIPSYISRIQGLASLDLSGNRLTGSIPSSLGNATSLSTLNLSNNRLKGRIPASLFHGATKNYFTTLELANNRLSGAIPRSFGGVNFKRLVLAGNRLTGDASFLFGYNKGLFQIDLSGNKLAFDMTKVEIPVQMSWIDLRKNRIYGGLPLGLANLRWGRLNVSYNHLCGKIPQGGILSQYDETCYFHNKCLCGSPLPAC